MKVQCRKEAYSTHHVLIVDNITSQEHIQRRQIFVALSVCSASVAAAAVYAAAAAAYAATVTATAAMGVSADRTAGIVVA